MSCVTCLAEADLPARIQVQQLYKAITNFCSAYRKTSTSTMTLTPGRLDVKSRPMLPTMMHTTPMPMRFKRKYPPMNNTMQPARKLAYRPSHAATKSWAPGHMQMPAPMAAYPPEPAPMAPYPPEPASMAPYPPKPAPMVPRMNAFKVSVDVWVIDSRYIE